jgi:LPXTG-motif cell wall-anchored protein
VTGDAETAGGSGETAEDRDDLAAEIVRLQARNEELEVERQRSPKQKVLRGLRAFAAVLCIVLGVLSLVVSVPAIWGRNLLLNTDRYVDTLKPVASDPGVQDVIVTQVTKQVVAHVDISQLADQVLPTRAAQLLGGPLESAFQGFVRTVTTKFVESDAFDKLWVTVNQLAHNQIVYALTAEAPKNAATTVSDNGKVVLNLAPIVDQVKQKLVDAGLTVAKNIPTIGATIEIANVHGLQQARKATHLLDVVANWLPWVGLAFLAGGIALSRKRRRAVLVSVLCVAAGMVVVGLSVTIGRNIYLSNIPTDILPRGTASYLFDTLVRYLRWGLRLVGLLALLIAFGVWVSGPGHAATSFRRGVERGPEWLGSKLDAGPVGPFVVRYTNALRIGVVALMVLILFLIDRPSLGTVIVLAVILVLLLLVIEVLRAAAKRSETEATDAPPPAPA